MFQLCGMLRIFSDTRWIFFAESSKKICKTLQKVLSFNIVFLNTWKTVWTIPASLFFFRSLIKIQFFWLFLKNGQNFPLDARESVSKTTVLTIFYSRSWEWVPLNSRVPPIFYWSFIFEPFWPNFEGKNRSAAVLFVSFRRNILRKENPSLIWLIFFLRKLAIRSDNVHGFLKNSKWSTRLVECNFDTPTRNSCCKAKKILKESLFAKLFPQYVFLHASNAVLTTLLKTICS